MSRTIFVKIVIHLPDLTRRFVNKGYVLAKARVNRLPDPNPTTRRNVASHRDRVKAPLWDP